MRLTTRPDAIPRTRQRQKDLTTTTGATHERVSVGNGPVATPASLAQREVGPPVGP